MDVRRRLDDEKAIDQTDKGAGRQHHRDGQPPFEPDAGAAGVYVLEPASLYEAFPAAEARRLVERHYTPKHGGWLAESELSVLSSQSLDRRVADKQTLTGRWRPGKQTGTSLTPRLTGNSRRRMRA